MQYTSGDASQVMSFAPILNGVELQQPPSDVLPNYLSKKGNPAKVRIIA